MGNIEWILAIAVAGPVLGSAMGVALRPKERTMHNMLAFAGGTMLAISFLELLPESVAQCGVPGAAAGIAIGLLTMMALNGMLPREQLRAGAQDARGAGRDLKRTSVLMILAIFLHNLPEGMAMASATVMKDPGAVITIALAIAIHNIPEGICTSTPYYYATGRRLAAFLWSSSTALPVLAGFLLGRFIFRDINPYAMGTMVGSVAGLMIYISCEELIPTAQREEKSLWPMVWLMGGVVFVLVLGTL